MELKDLLNFYLEVLKAIAWPGLVLIFLNIFQENIADFFKRVTSFKISKDMIEMYAGIMESNTPQRSKVMLGLVAGQDIFPKIPLDKPATLFWCANDLMWIQDMLYRDAPGWSIARSLENLGVYVNNLGYQKPLFENKIGLLIQDVNRAIEPGSIFWTRDYRLDLVRKIEEVKMFLAERVQEGEPNFTKLRVFKPEGFDEHHS
jgi:hypothetical protein